VLVLYVHPLLGRGLARLLTAQAGVTATAVAECDFPARESALRKRPDLIIAEATGDTPAIEATDSLPVVFVRVDSEDGASLGQPLADPDLIIALARGLAEVPLEASARRSGPVHAHPGHH
jgi:hypothetical protein